MVWVDDVCCWLRREEGDEREGHIYSTGTVILD